MNTINKLQQAVRQRQKPKVYSYYLQLLNLVPCCCRHSGQSTRRHCKETSCATSVKVVAGVRASLSGPGRAICWRTSPQSQHPVGSVVNADRPCSSPSHEWKTNTHTQTRKHFVTVKILLDSETMRHCRISPYRFLAVCQWRC